MSTICISASVFSLSPRRLSLYHSLFPFLSAVEEVAAESDESISEAEEGDPGEGDDEGEPSAAEEEPNPPEEVLYHMHN